jgi:molybdopterin-biosynthesis enzyme MoeA-like protein
VNGIANPNFYSVIIGTELLNGRRKDAHFEFLNQELLKRGFTQKANFVIKDDPAFMLDIFNLIKQDKNSVMFCFGGIGATPDDYTREVAAQAFTQNNMQYHEEAKKIIEDRFGTEAYPHRVQMAYLPIGAKLLHNVVNQVPGFYLQNRFFFTPGFPSMAQSMILQALDTYYIKNTVQTFRKTLTAFTGENSIIDLMKNTPLEVEVSSLPKIKPNDVREVVLSLSSSNHELLEKCFKQYEAFLKQEQIEYKIGE